MSYRVEITDRAAREIEEQFDYLQERSEAAAERWREGLLAVIESLAEHPERCPRAPEADWFGPNLRQLVYGKKRQAQRILFVVLDEAVVILRVRHSAQDALGPDAF